MNNGYTFDQTDYTPKSKSEEKSRLSLLYNHHSRTDIAMQQ